MDLAISGNGFSSPKPPTARPATRNGQCPGGQDSFIVNNGDKLMGWGVVLVTAPAKMREGAATPESQHDMIQPVAFGWQHHQQNGASDHQP